MMISGALLHHDGYAFEDPEQRAKKEKRNMDLLLKKLEDLFTNLAIPATFGSSHSSQSIVKYHLPEHLFITAFRAAEKSLIQGKSIRMSAYFWKSAVILNLPELDEWIAKAEDMFPNSVFTKVDVAYYAFGTDWERKKYGSCVSRGEKFQRF